MPLHQNKSTTQKKKRSKTWTLMPRKITAFHTKKLLSLLKSKFIHEFGFKRKGTRTKSNPPEGIKYNGVIVHHTIQNDDTNQ